MTISDSIGRELDRLEAANRQLLPTPHSEPSVGFTEPKPYPAVDAGIGSYCCSIADVGDLQHLLIHRQSDLTRETFEKLLGELAWLKGRLRTERDEKFPGWDKLRTWRGKKYQ